MNFWTAEQDAMLTRLWAEGCSASQISHQLASTSRSRNAVIGRAHRLKLPPRPARQSMRQPAPRKPRRFKPKATPTPMINGEPTMRQLTLMQLKASSCRWPIGDSPFLFCARTVAERRSYCLHHCAKAYTSTTITRGLK
jgi:GcrA cell cycle regulator